MLGKRISKRKPLTELYVNGSFTEDRGAWEKEPQRQCEEVNVDPDETVEEQKKRIMTLKEDGDRHFSFMEQDDAPSSLRIVKLVILRKPDAAPKKGIRSYRASALTSVMSMWYAACIILRLENEKELEAVARVWD